MNTPNKLSMSRIFFAVLIVIFYLMIVTNNKVKIVVKLITVVFILGAITDILDGYIARKRNIKTKLGEFLDPIADKLLVNSTFIILLSLLEKAPKNKILVVCLIITIARDSIVHLARMLSSGKEVAAANKYGKIKTILQMVGLSVLTTSLWYQGTIGAYTSLMNYNVGFWILIAATVMSVVSGYIYVMGLRKYFITAEGIELTFDEKTKAQSKTFNVKFNGWFKKTKAESKEENKNTDKDVSNGTTDDTKQPAKNWFQKLKYKDSDKDILDETKEAEQDSVTETTDDIKESSKSNDWFKKRKNEYSDKDTLDETTDGDQESTTDETDTSEKN